MTHNLKTWPEYFRAVRDGYKRFEVRKADRDFRVGDRLILMEFDPAVGTFTSADDLTFYISYVLPGGAFGVQEGYCVLGLVETLAECPAEEGGTP